MHSGRLLRVGAAAAALAFVLTPGVARADCAMPPEVPEAARTADIVFVGTVTQTTARDTWASVAVDEIWRGPDLPAAVLVKGGSGGDGVSSVERSFKAGVKYLFFPYRDDEGGLADNICTNTVEWSADLDGLRPADVRQPSGTEEAAGGFDFGELVAPLAVAVVAAAALLVTGLLARGRST